jgi:putative membrane protein
MMGSMSSQDDAERATDRRDMPEAAVRDHLANERTLLAWQRTALGVVAIGFLVDRFALEGGGITVAGSVLGIALILVGAVVSVVGVYRFMRTEREIDTHTCRPALLAHLVLTAAVVAGAVALVLFLLSTLD